MPTFDEAAIRKAATWQDFKEAQGLLNIGAVIDSEKTRDGWKGSVKSGKRVFRPTVTARTATWLDATCPCPANQREGRFCPHAIAAGLHLINPQPTKSPEKTTRAPAHQVTTTKPAQNPIPEISWAIRFQGDWQKSLTRGHAAISLISSDSPSTPADSRITAWLLSQKVTSPPPIQLALNPQTLPTFLTLLEAHPSITTSDAPLSIETGAQLHLADCSLTGEYIRLTPSAETTASIDSSSWKISPNSLAKIGSTPPPAAIAPTLALLAAGKPCRLPLAAFLTHLDSLQSHLDFSASEWFESLQFIPATPEIELTLTGSERQLTATLSTSYSQALPSLENHRILTKNPTAETEALHHGARLFKPLSNGSLGLTTPEQIQHFLTQTLPHLPKSWKTTLSPALEKLASSYVFISPHIEILDSSHNSLNFNLSYRSNNGTDIPAAEIRRLLRSGAATSYKHRDKQLIISKDIHNLIDPLFEDLELEQQSGSYTASKASAEVIREIASNLRNSVNPEEKSTFPQLIHIPEIEATLRPYQAKGFSWLVDRLDKFQGALLADDMGLGKTIQTIACIEHFFASYSQSSTEPRPALIVVTTSLLGNWRAEFNRFAPDRRIITLHGAKRDALREQIRPTDVVLTTYATLARDLAYHLRQEYSIAVIDEASLIRNPDTDHSKAVARLNATRRIALTGTPVENSARDLWSIFRFIQPGWLGTKKDFQDRYEIPLKDPETSPRASTLLRLKTSPFTLRRTKSEVAPELPSKIHIDEYCTLSKDQLTTYRELQKEGLRKIEDIRASGQKAAARMQTLTTLLRLRQTCGDLALLGSEKLATLPIPRRSAKLERLLEITENAIASGSRILVFSQFAKQLLEIESALTAVGIPSLRLDGSTRDRQSLVDRFQSPDGSPLFLISLKAGGYGLNLTAADIVVHFDPWWNPAAEAQATDRAHRIGQTKPVTVFRLLTRNTVEEKVTRLQSSKKALA
ncbi:MAG: SNF2 family helicase, partial [Opitutales bacterium]|nr:SNF2 family helicase [Opitutales bacterium]